MRRAAALAAALLLAGAGVVLLLLAVDVRLWQTRIAADDVALRTEPHRRDLWVPPQLLPGDPARRLLSLDDDLRFRQALQIFKLGRPPVLGYMGSPQLTVYRTEAQAMFARTLEEDGVPARRAREETLLGVLELMAVGGNDPSQRQQFLQRAVDFFQQALAIDPAREEAKFDLELALRLLENGRQGAGARSGVGGSVAKGEESGTGY